MPRGNPLNISLGPGTLYIAPLGSDEPTGIDDDLDTAWTALGYTNDGSTQSFSPSYEDVEVAEELEPLDSVATGRTISASFTLAELTAKNLKAAMNGGTITHVPVAGAVTRAHTKFEPPEVGEDVKVMLLFEAEDTLERVLYREVKQVGAIETARRKGAEKAGIPCEFRAYKPAAGGKAFTRWSGRGSDASA
jgi:hypothetical protein